MSDAPEIVLTTLNARHIHAAFGLRYLMANLGDLQERTKLIEFDINQRPLDITETILKLKPRILGIGVYIWNIHQVTEVVALLKTIRPELVIIVGGPEVSYETADLPLMDRVDHVITGEADLEFSRVCRHLLNAPPTGNATLPKVIHAPLPEVHQLSLPYDEYTSEDCAHRIIYVEASRGCPYRCEYCLSSLDIPVRTFELDPLLKSFERLLQRGVRQFKFVDRTFNLNLQFSRRILEFFLERMVDGLFLHFEMVPDRLPETLRDVIAKFPEGSLQFEIGIQTLNPEVEERISRRQNQERMADNLHWLRNHSGVHLHADLIAGLPGETLESFGEGFDRLLAWRPHEIQVGILKRLRGTPILRHTAPWGMVYSPTAPYEILQTQHMDFSTVARLRRFSRFWDIFHNSGNFIEALPLLWSDRSPFHAFLEFSDSLHADGVSTGGIALPRQYSLLGRHLSEALAIPWETCREHLERDYLRPGRRDLPDVLRPPSDPSSRSNRYRSAPPKKQTTSVEPSSANSVRLPKRQHRHHPPPAHRGDDVSPS